MNEERAREPRPRFLAGDASRRLVAAAVLCVAAVALLWGPRGGLVFVILLLAIGALARALTAGGGVASDSDAPPPGRDPSDLEPPPTVEAPPAAATSGGTWRRLWHRVGEGLQSPPAPGRAVTMLLLGGALLVAAAVRIPALDRVPAGLYCDEAAIGYNAYSILETGRDEHGTFLPLFIPSFGVALKNPLYVYSAIPFVALGLSESSLRLTSALYGLLAVAATYLLGRTLGGTTVGLLGALLLALSPWHVHFSRIAFELISLPALFVAGLAFALQGLERTGKRRDLVLAALFFALTPYAYAVAIVFVPLMLIALVGLERRSFHGRGRDALIALGVMVAVLFPFLWFQLTDPLSMQRIGLIGIVQPGRSWAATAAEFAANYRQYFGLEFLFREGDPLPRHSVRGFGQNLASLAPWMLLGLAAAFTRRRTGLLLLAWLLAYPVAAALVRETPSATRSIVGAPLFALLAAIGLASTWVVLGGLAPGPRRLLRGGFLALVVATVGSETIAYFREYAIDYPRYSAPTYAGFQYGYRESLAIMEPRRARYDRLVLTATEVNQPWIFPLFYTHRDPAEYQRTGDIGYDIFVPEEVGRYDLASERILFQAHPRDLHMFEQYRVVDDVIAPDGSLAYRIVEPLRRRAYLGGWVATLPLPARLAAAPEPLLAIDADTPRQAIDTRFSFVDLNGSLEGNPEHVCAKVSTRLSLDDPERAVGLECLGSEDFFQAFLDGHPLAAGAWLDRARPHRIPLTLGLGEHRLDVLSCETVGDWYFACAVVDESGNSLEVPSVRIPSAFEGTPSQGESR